MNPRNKNIFHIFFNPISFFFILFLFTGASWNVISYLESKGILSITDENDFYSVMGRSRFYYAGPDNGRFFSGVFQSQLEKASSDHFPLFAIFAYKKITRYIDNLFLSILPEDSAPFVPIGGGVLLSPQTKYLFSTPDIFSQSEFSSLSRQADFYNRIQNEHPSIHLFIVPVLDKSDWISFSGPVKSNSRLFRGDKYVKEFRSYLLPHIKCFWPGESYPPEKAIQLYFKTDHHLNMIGAYQAYIQLIENILPGANNSKSIVQSTSNWFIVPNVEFRGSYSRLAGKFDKIFDNLMDSDFFIPDYDIYINNIHSDLGFIKTRRFNYLNGKYPKNLFHNHYGSYYGADYGIIEFINPEESSLGNIVVIGDSNDNALAPLLASRFSHSYFIDLRLYEDAAGCPFHLNNFIKHNRIDVVLFFASQHYIFGFTPWEYN